MDADVKNTSERGGDEVVEVYLTSPQLPGALTHALRRSTLVYLDAGETKHIQFILSPRDLSEADIAGKHLLSPGTYHINIGGGQPGTAAPRVITVFKTKGKKSSQSN